MENKKIINIQKLTDISLENVSGGKLPLALDFGLTTFGLVGTPVGMLGGIACSIAGSVYSSKSQTAIKNGDTKNAEKYAKTTKGLNIATAALSSLVPVGISAIVVGSIDGLQHPEVATATKQVMNKLSKSK